MLPPITTKINNKADVVRIQSLYVPIGVVMVLLLITKENPILFIVQLFCGEK